ncbi:MAG: MCP four helix bundle domain-containing protein, partial [Deltaproteobacteria bacterium]
MKNIGIAKKLAVGLGSIVVLMLVVAGAGFWGLETTHDTIRVILEDDSKLAEDSLRARIDILDMRRFEKDFQLNMGDKPTQATYAEKWSKAYDDLQVRLDNMEKHSLTSDDKALADAMRNELATYIGGYSDMKSRIESGELRTPQASNHYISKYKDAIHQMEDTSEAFATENIERMHNKDSVVTAVKTKVL